MLALCMFAAVHGMLKLTGSEDTVLEHEEADDSLAVGSAGIPPSPGEVEGMAASGGDKKHSIEHIRACGWELSAMWDLDMIEKTLDARGIEITSPHLGGTTVPGVFLCTTRCGKRCVIKMSLVLNLGGRLIRQPGCNDVSMEGEVLTMLNRWKVRGVPICVQNIADRKHDYVIMEEISGKTVDKLYMKNMDLILQIYGLDTQTLRNRRKSGRVSAILKRNRFQIMANIKELITKDEWRELLRVLRELKRIAIEVGELGVVKKEYTLRDVMVKDDGDVFMIDFGNVAWMKNMTWEDVESCKMENLHGVLKTALQIYGDKMETDLTPFVEALHRDGIKPPTWMGLQEIISAWAGENGVRNMTGRTLSLHYGRFEKESEKINPWEMDDFGNLVPESMPETHAPLHAFVKGMFPDELQELFREIAIEIKECKKRILEPSTKESVGDFEEYAHGVQVRREQESAD